MARPKRQYSDVDKATALLSLEANGGNVLRTARALNIPQQTLREWAASKHTSVDVPNIRDKKRPELIDLFLNEVYEAVGLMPDKRAEASYSDLGRMVGILTDKIQLLKGGVTERIDQRVTVVYEGDND